MKDFIQYGNTKIDFELNYTNRKTLGIKINPDTSVRVNAPVNIGIGRIKEHLIKKASWIIRQKSLFLNADTVDFSYQIKSGYSILYLGRQYKIVVEKTQVNDIAYKGNLFLVSVKNKNKAQDLFKKWLRKRAEFKISEIAKPIINKFKIKYHSPSEIYFQNMATRWGSCTINDKLIFNPNLIHVPKRCIEYVVMHELCHLVHKHHDKEFFSLLTLMMPDWEKRKEKLDSYKKS